MLKRDDALKTVVKFSTPGIKDGNAVTFTGTGFFLLKDPQHLFLITANHVTKDFNDQTMVYMAGKSNNVLSVTLNQLKGSHSIINHSNADVSAIPVDIPYFNTLSAGVTLYPISVIDVNKINKISRDEELTSIGFPKGLGIGARFEPLTFRSFPASNIISNVSGLDGGYISDIFVMENASCGGYSGCPIIDLGYKVSGLISQSSNTYIYGVMHGTISDDTGGKMAVVTPAYYILQII